MKWHVTIETPTDVYEFDIRRESMGEVFIPLMRSMDSYGILQKDVVSITMETKDD